MCLLTPMLEGSTPRWKIGERYERGLSGIFEIMMNLAWVCGQWNRRQVAD